MLRNDYVTTFSASLFVQICTVVQGIVIARILGPMGRGEFAAVMLWPTVFASIGLMGGHIALAKQAARLSDPGGLLRASLLLSVLTSSVCSIACFFAIPVLMPGAQESLVDITRLFVLFIPLNHFAVNINSIDQGIGDFKIFNLTRIVLYPLYLLTIVFLWLMQKESVETIAIAFLFANAAVVCLRLFLWLHKVSLFGRVFSVIKLFVQGFRFGLAGIAEAICGQADKALMLWLLGAENLGFYAVALSASGAVSSITNSAGLVLFTHSAQAAIGEGFAKVTKVFRISFLLWLLFGLALATLMDFLLPLVYGKNYVPAVFPAKLLIVGSALMGLSRVLEQSLQGQGRAFIGLVGKVAGLVVMGTSGAFLAVQQGISGVCIAYILGQTVTLTVMIWNNNHHYAIPFRFSQYFFMSLSELRGIIGNSDSP